MPATLSTLLRHKVTKRHGPLLRVVKDGWAAIARSTKQPAASAWLHELDDRSLRDIGLARFQIDAAVRGKRADARRSIVIAETTAWS